MPTAVHVKHYLYIKFSVGVLAAKEGMVVAGNRGTIGELVIKVVLAGNHEVDTVVEVGAAVVVEAGVVMLLVLPDSG